MIDARSETVMQKPAFKQSFARRRCLIPADGFFEWAKDGAKKRPFDIGMKDGSVFAFAGLWDSWEPPDSAPVESCTILTTAASSLVSELHDRMPVILPPGHYEVQLHGPVAEASSLLLPFDPALMKQYEVSSLVNNPKNDSPKCIAPVVA
jgi:putative SOS response-associated peptidase YedK